MSKPELIKISVREGGEWMEISGTIAHRVMEHQGEKIAVAIIPLRKLAPEEVPGCHNLIENIALLRGLKELMDKV